MAEVYIPDPRAIFRRLPDGAVVYIPANESYLGLNETGACIWELIPSRGIDFWALLRAVASVYPDASIDDLRLDLTAWLQEVTDLGLVQAEAVAAA